MGMFNKRQETEIDMLGHLFFRFFLESKSSYSKENMVGLSNGGGKGKLVQRDRVQIMDSKRSLKNPMCFENLFERFDLPMDLL